MQSVSMHWAVLLKATVNVFLFGGERAVHNLRKIVKKVQNAAFSTTINSESKWKEAESLHENLSLQTIETHQARAQVTKCFTFHWMRSVFESIYFLNKFKKQIKKNTLSTRQVVQNGTPCES